MEAGTTAPNTPAPGTVNPQAGLCGPAEVPPTIFRMGASSTPESAAQAFLTEHKWPVGLQDCFFQNLAEVPMRYFICDDSGSMNTSDRKRIVTRSDGTQFAITCSRWSELGNTMSFHAQLAHLAQAPSEFRFLNRSPPIVIGDGSSDGASRVQSLQGIFAGRPDGGTPLCKHIRAVTEQIRAREKELRATNRKCAVIIATDGESSDGDVADALALLQGLPVWVVICLCSDEWKVVKYWNEIGDFRGLDMDVVDDLVGEAEEVTNKFPWLTYAEPMHRIREFGIQMNWIRFAAIDCYRSLDQVGDICALVLGGDSSMYPNPDMDWDEFRAAVERELAMSPQVYCPQKKTIQPWINLTVVQEMCTP